MNWDIFWTVALILFIIFLLWLSHKVDDDDDEKYGDFVA